MTQYVPYTACTDIVVKDSEKSMQWLSSSKQINTENCRLVFFSVRQIVDLLQNLILFLLAHY